MTQYQDEGTTWHNWMKVKWLNGSQTELGSTENITDSRTDSVRLGYTIASKK